ncbi:hypothetical protein EP7_005299 [Isosphaeraceae bacterium EP7]
MAKFAAEIEGTIEAVSDAGNGDALMVVMGMSVLIKANAFANHRVRTPTKNKTVDHAQLIKTNSLPGRKNVPANEGFKGGTAIVAGNFDDTIQQIVVEFDPTPVPGQIAALELHPSVEVGPPENVLLGPFTGNAATGVFSVNGVPVKRLGADFPADDRLVGEPIQNEFGFDIVPGSIPPSALVSVDGYLSDDVQVSGKFPFVGFNFVVDSPAATLTITNQRQVSITRASARNDVTDYSLELRGGITTPSNQPFGATPTLLIFGFALNSTQSFPITAQETRMGPLVPGGFATWRIRTTGNGSAPERVVVRISGVPGPIESGEEFVDVREG